MALGVKITRTTPLTPQGVFVQWELTGASEAGQHVFEIFRSQSPDGPWTWLEGPTADEYNFADRFPTGSTASEADVRQLTLTHDLYYRVVVTPPSGTANQVSVVRQVEPTLSGRQRLLKKKMLRDLAKQLRHLNGIPVAIFKRMVWGPRCPKCFDKLTREVVRSGCATCYGTGFTPGYHTPVITWARRSVSAVESTVTPQGKVDLNILQMWMLDTPAVDEGDLVVSIPDNRRFVVKKVLPTELLTVTVHQKLVVSELARSAPEFRLVADLTRTPPLF